MTTTLRAFLVLTPSLVFAAGPQLTVDVAAGRHPINPWIYGINTWSDNGLQTMMRIPLVRWGGDDATSYNWQNSVKNNTGDNPWVYENYKVSPGFDAFHEKNLRTGAATLGTVSLMDWLPSKAGVCSFSVAKYGAQKAMNPDNKDCGNGVLLSGANIANDPNDAYVPAGPATAAQWVEHILGTYGRAVAGGARLWSLDNEPEWWDSNHYDVYKSPATYDDMLARDTAYAAAIKQADPGALVTGPVPGGWSGMLFSKADMLAGWGKSPYQYWDNPVDQKAHGLAWIPWYLQKMKAADVAGGRRLLDVLDVHAYITPGGLSGSVGNAAMETLRMTSTRALWDPAYIVPGGQIWDASGKQVPPAMVPTLRQWVTDNYPGTMTGITEYSWGALDTITGAVAQADILGIFGREGLDLATLWTTPNPTDPGAFAFKIFLNYDGAGSQFGDSGVSAVSSDPDTLSVFAAQRSDSALTILVLNKTAADVASGITLANSQAAGAAQVWQYSGANLKSIVRLPDVPAIGNSVGTTFAAYSMTLFVIPQTTNLAQPVVASVNSAASYDPAGLAPGEIIVLFGKNLTGSPVAAPSYNGNGLLTTSLGGTRVRFNGIPAPLIYVTSGQLSAIVPYEAAALASGTVQVVVENQGSASAPFTATLLPAHPAIFTNDQSGFGQGAILNVSQLAACGTDATVCRNGPKNPAMRGEYVAIFGTGEGLTNVPGVDGRVTSSPLPAPVLSCSATVAGQPASIQYCGSAPGAPAGLFQVNALVPTTISAGSAVPVSVVIGTAATQTTVTLAVK